MGLLDELTGGENKNAQAALAAALANIQNVQTPTAEQLKLSPLANYYSTGELSPALMQAAQAGPSAYDSQNLSTVPMSTMQQVLAKQMATANANGMTPQAQAQIAQAEQAMNRNVQGQRGAIEQNFAGRGVPQSLISAALQNQSVGQEAQQGYQNALQAQANMATQGQTALQNAGQLGGQMYGLQAGQANTVSAAQNALNQFNAANTQQANAQNQGANMAANTYNTQNQQTVANQNVGGRNQVQYQNQVEAPQQAANLALQKAGAMAGVGQAQAGAHTAAGQQQAALYGGLLGAGATLGAGAMAPGPVVLGRAKGGMIPDPNIPATPFVDGGQVPGHALVPGDSQRNDTVMAKLSPGEFVVPREAMSDPRIRNFLAQNVPTPKPPTAHPSDIASILRALGTLREGA